jgi:hypothetical protein
MGHRLGSSSRPVLVKEDVPRYRGNVFWNYKGLEVRAVDVAGDVEFHETHT